MSFMNKTMLPTVQEYLTHLKIERNCSHHTITGYRRELNHFIKSLPEDVDVSSITIQQIREWLSTLEGYKPATIERKITALKSFFNFCEDQEYIIQHPARKIRMPKRGRRLPNYLTEEELSIILKTPLQRYPSKVNMHMEVRDDAIIKLMIFTGLRRQEVLNLNVDDIRLQEGILFVRQGKENKDRFVPLTRELNITLKKYLEFRATTFKQEKSSSLFLSFTGRRLDYYAIHKLFKRHLRNCGIKKTVTLHTLRHSFATHLLRQGVDLFTIKEMLGHENIQSTQIYLHTNFKQQQIAIEKLSFFNTSQLDK